MARLLLALVGVLLLALAALALVWLLGQLLAGVGTVLAGAAGVLLRLLWFLVVAGLLGGVAFFLASAWRPVGGRAQRRVAAAPPAAPPAPTPAERA